MSLRLGGARITTLRARGRDIGSFGMRFRDGIDEEGDRKGDCGGDESRVADP